MHTKPKSLTSAVLSLLFTFHGYAHAQETDTAPYPELSSEFPGPDAKFSTSSIVSGSTASLKLTNKVCNLDTTGLLFNWDNPGFGTMLLRPLEPSYCAYVERNVRDVVLIQDAPIKFTQSERVWSTSVYEPRIILSSEQSVSEFLSTVWGLVDNKNNVEPARVKMEVEVAKSEQKARFDISWTSATTVVAVGLHSSFVTEANRNAIVDAASKNEIFTQFVPAEKLGLEDAFPGAYSEVNYLLLESKQNTATLSFETISDAYQPYSQPAIILNRHYQIVGFFKY